MLCTLSQPRMYHTTTKREKTKHSIIISELIRVYCIIIMPVLGNYKSRQVTTVKTTILLLLDTPTTIFSTIVFLYLIRAAYLPNLRCHSK